jgi:hypothetical protein
VAALVAAQAHPRQLAAAYTAQLAQLTGSPRPPAYLQWLALAHACTTSPGMCGSDLRDFAYHSGLQGQYSYQLAIAAYERQHYGGGGRTLLLAAGLVVAVAAAPEILAATAPEAAADAAADAAAAEDADSADTVQIFRNVDSREFGSIASTGRFGTGEGQMEGKWFATQSEHADQWGQLLNRGDGVTVETRVPSSVAGQLYSDAGKLDGIGPAYYANSGQLELINQSMDGIRLWP